MMNESMKVGLKNLIVLGCLHVQTVFELTL